MLSQSSGVSVIREGDSSYLMQNIWEAYYANVFGEEGGWCCSFPAQPQSIEPLTISAVLFEATKSDHGAEIIQVTVIHRAIYNMV